MGRNKNKENRSASRKLNGVAPQGNKKRDTGLPTFFKQRKTASLPLNDAVARRGENGRGKPTGTELDMDMDGATPSAIEGVLRKGKERQEDHLMNTDYSLDKASRDLSLVGKRDSSTKAFMKDVKNVIENSDVLLQVLDARDPLGCRSRQTEVMAMGAGKKIVLILNKVDLIPTSNLQAWLKYLRNDFPTLAFKASTQQQRGNLKQGKAVLPSAHAPLDESKAGSTLSFGSEAIGAASLLQLLKNYSRTSAKGSHLKQQLTVGVVGPPNVGKSSLINSLLRTRACAVASTPGWTKVVQGVMLEKGIRLLDCPGVVVSSHDAAAAAQFSGGGASDKMNDAWSVLRNTIKVELIEDPIAPVQALLSRVDAEQLSKLYNIEGGFNEGDAQDFLLRVSLMRGKLAKGGIPDLEGAARIVLHDWNIGRISFYSQVPAVHPSARVNQIKGRGDGGEELDLPNDTITASERGSNVPGASLVSKFAEAFDLEALLGEADAEAIGGRDGSQAEGARELIKARERREVIEQASGTYEAIAEDEEGVGGDDADKEAANASFSTLGKRGREHREDDIDSDSDGDDDTDVRTGVQMSLTSDTEDEEGRSPFVHLLPSGNGDLPPTKQRKAEIISQRKKDLLTVFSEQELEGMAPRMGDARRAAKKKKKRLQRSEAGLVDVWNKGLDLPKDDTVAEQSAKSRGLFDILPLQEREGKGRDEEEEEEEEEEEL